MLIKIRSPQVNIPGGTYDSPVSDEIAVHVLMPIDNVNNRCIRYRDGGLWMAYF